MHVPGEWTAFAESWIAGKRVAIDSHSKRCRRPAPDRSHGPRSKSFHLINDAQCNRFQRRHITSIFRGRGPTGRWPPRAMKGISGEGRWTPLRRPCGRLSGRRKTVDVSCHQNSLNGGGYRRYGVRDEPRRAMADTHSHRTQPISQVVRSDASTKDAQSAIAGHQLLGCWRIDLISAE
jgi:hypothetical protein